MYLKPWIFFIATTLAVSTSAHASPWVPEAGEVYAKLDERFFLASRYTDGVGETSDIDSYQEFTTSLYSEVGLGSHWAALLAWDVVRVFRLADSGQDALVRPGDLHLGARWAPVDLGGGGRIAIQGWLGIPLTSGETIAAVLDDDGRQVASVRASPGVFNVAADLSIGWAFTYVFWDASVGYLQRFGGQDGAFRWQASVGGRWWRLRGTARLAGVHRVDTGSAPLFENPSGLSNGSTHTSAIAELGFAASDAWTVGVTSQFSLAGLSVRRHGRGAVFSAFVSFSP